MKVFEFDGRYLILNDAEVDYWIKTGCFGRIEEADNDDAEYIKKRDEMITNGDENYYKFVIPKQRAA